MEKAPKIELEEKEKEKEKEEEKEKDKEMEKDKEEEENFKLFEYVTKKFKVEGIKNFKYNNGSFIISGKDIIYDPINGKRRFFYNGSKIFYFTNEQKNIFQKQYFIHDEDSLTYALTKTEISNGILKLYKKDSADNKGNENYKDSNINKDNENNKDNINNKESNNNEENINNKDNENNKIQDKEKYDSNKSDSATSINSMEIQEILESNYNLIEQPKDIKPIKIFTKQHFEDRYKAYYIYQLDFNFKYLKENYTKNEIDFIAQQNEWTTQLKNSIRSHKIKSYCYIFGPRGIGKTTILLKYLNLHQIPRLYFSLHIMSKIKSEFTNNKIKKYCLYETIYIFKNEKEMDDFSNTKLKNISNNINLMEFISSYIDLIIDYSSRSKINRKIWVIIDDYEPKLYDNKKIIEDIIKNIEENKEKFFLCILGKGKYMNEKFCQCYSKRPKKFFGNYWNISLEKEMSEKDKFLSVPKYFYKYKNSSDINSIEDIIKKEISEIFKNLNLETLIFLNKYLDLKIKLEDFEEHIINLPFEVLSIENFLDENKDICIKYSFNSEIYKSIFDSLYKGLLKIDNLKSKMIIFKEENKGKNGIDFEDLIVEQLWNNTIEYLIFPENNKLKIDEIYKLKSNIDDKRNGLKLEEPIIIRQLVFKGKYYDLLLILNKDDKKIAIFVQIGLSKTGNEITIYVKNLINNNEMYKKGIENLIAHKIDQLGFLLIFEYEHQKKLIENNNTSNGVGFCENNHIDYLIYKNFAFYKKVDDSEPIKSINVIKNTMIVNNDDSLKLNLDVIRDNFTKLCLSFALKHKKHPNYPLNENEKKNILEFISNKFNIAYEEIEYAFGLEDNVQEFNGFGMINSGNFNQINIYANQISKYFCYNNQLFEIEKEKVQNLKGHLDKKEKYKWDIYFLKKKRQLKE